MVWGGRSAVTDLDGKYTLCSVSSQVKVINVDRSMLPGGARMVLSGNRNAGTGYSLFIDTQSQLVRAEFIEGSCSAEVMDEVKVRRIQAGTAGKASIARQVKGSSQ